MRTYGLAALDLDVGSAFAVALGGDHVRADANVPVGVVPAIGAPSRMWPPAAPTGRAARASSSELRRRAFAASQGAARETDGCDGDDEEEVRGRPEAHRHAACVRAAERAELEQEAGQPAGLGGQLAQAVLVE